MKSFSKSLIAVLISAVGLSAHAGVTPVFVSCYADDGSHLQLIFDTEQKQFSYRYAHATYVDDFDVAPQGYLGAASSSVTTSIPADQHHIELKAQIVGGDAIQPLILASAEVIFDRDETGSLHMTSHSIYHLSQPYDIQTFHAGICYVQ